MIMNTCKSKALEKIFRKKEDGRQDKWVGFINSVTFKK
jgi:hypothetical protein